MKCAACETRSDDSRVFYFIGWQEKIVICKDCQGRAMVWAAKQALQAERLDKAIQQSGGLFFDMSQHVLAIDVSRGLGNAAIPGIDTNVLGSNAEQLTLKEENARHEGMPIMWEKLPEPIHYKVAEKQADNPFYTKGNQP